MLQVRKQLAIAAGTTWLAWLVLGFLGVRGWSTYDGGITAFAFALAGLSQILLWVGLAFAAGAVFSHVLIVRDNDIYEMADDACCADGPCCSTDDAQGDSSS